MKHQIWQVGAIILLAILIRSIHFSDHLNFSTDQALFSAKTLEIWNQKDIELIGPRFSLEYEGRHMFHGPLIYYFQMIFLVLGDFDPIRASYLFMLFACLMIIPLYYGVKWLANQRLALLISVIYALLPFYINYTRFFWNPNFQLALSPLLLLLMGLYQKYQRRWLFFAVSVFAGILLEFHYSFLLIVIGIMGYYFVYKKHTLFGLPLFVLGVSLGMLPIIIFELRNNFYNTQTFMLFLQNWDVVFNGRTKPGSIEPHYILVLSLFLLLLAGALVSRLITYKLIVLVLIGCIGWSLWLFTPKPTHGFGMSPDWNYQDEDRAYKIIKEANTLEFNVMNLVYDTSAAVQKYLLKKEGVVINYDNYYTNKYLYIITDRTDFMDDPAYEIKNFTPYKLLNAWQVDNRYNLYLVQRL